MLREPAAWHSQAPDLGFSWHASDSRHIGTSALFKYAQTLPSTVIMFDVGDTLIDSDGELIAGVQEALESIAGFDMVELVLVSDVTMPDNPTPAQIEALFADYCDVIQGAGLEPFFAPLDRHATISTQAGVRKPDRRIFDLALRRLGMPGTSLRASVLITENESHTAAARGLGMEGLQYRPNGPPTANSFSDWADAPPRIRALIDRSCASANGERKPPED